MGEVPLEYGQIDMISNVPSVPEKTTDPSDNHEIHARHKEHRLTHRGQDRCVCVCVFFFGGVPGMVSRGN